jgi:hypothetical protein
MTVQTFQISFETVFDPANPVIVIAHEMEHDKAVVFGQDNDVEEEDDAQEIDDESSLLNRDTYNHTVTATWIDLTTLETSFSKVLENLSVVALRLLPELI